MFKKVAHSFVLKEKNGEENGQNSNTNVFPRKYIGGLETGFIESGRRRRLNQSELKKQHVTSEKRGKICKWQQAREKIALEKWNARQARENNWRKAR